MKRRHYLTALGIGSIPFAGCLSEASPESTTESSPEETRETSPDGTKPETSTGGSSGGCRMTDAVSFDVASETFVVVTDDNDVEALVFTLENQGTCSLTVVTHAWSIERKSGGEWQQEVRGDGGEERTIPKGGVHKWSLSLTAHPTPFTRKKTFLVADLSEGTYRFSVSGTMDNEERITRTTTFDVEKRTKAETMSDSS